MFLNKMIARVRVYAMYLRLAPFDISAPGGRSIERHRRALLTGVSALLAKMIAVSTSFAVRGGWQIRIADSLHHNGLRLSVQSLGVRVRFLPCRTSEWLPDLYEWVEVCLSPPLPSFTCQCLYTRMRLLIV